MQDLQGDVEYYLLSWNTTAENKSLRIEADVNYTVIGDLHPNTKYQIFFHVFNGVHSIDSEGVHVTTLDGGWLVVNAACLKNLRMKLIDFCWG